MVNPCREESSDESTIISSQTSTLTRDQNQDDLQAVLGLNIQGQLVINSDDEDDEDQESDGAYGGIELSRHQQMHQHDDEGEDISDDQENGKLNARDIEKEEFKKISCDLILYFVSRFLMMFEL